VIGLAAYVAFLGVSLAVICTPGQDTALTVRNTLAGGRRAGVATACGVATGQAVWTLATSAGLALVIVASAPVFLAIRLAGAAYLVYLGLRLLWRPAEGAAGASNKTGARPSFAQGLVSNLTNGKMVAFFISLLPPFAGAHPSFVILLLLGLNFCVLTLAWLCAYAFAVERMRSRLAGRRLRRVLDRAVGSVLVLLGLRVGWEAVRA